MAFIVDPRQRKTRFLEIVEFTDAGFVWGPTAQPGDWQVNIPFTFTKNLVNVSFHVCVSTFVLVQGTIFRGYEAQVYRNPAQERLGNGTVSITGLRDGKLSDVKGHILVEAD